jgi:tRNA dimethylallyltransferase
VIELVGPVVVLVGPTAVGKSALALHLAERFDAEIVTADSRQVYRYMDIGTAKPTPSEQAIARHHMIDLVEPSDTYSAQRFREEGLRVLRGIAATGRPALVAGGTGFYIRALIDGMVLPPVPPDHAYRADLRALAAADGAEVIHARLASSDPASAARIHPRNVPRVIRALEIVRAIGGPVPVQPSAGAIPALFVGLSLDRAELDAIADARVLAQMEAGLLRETETLLAMGYSPESVALSGFGYRELIAYLRGDWSLDEAIAGYQSATRRYIRRQLTWFRAERRITWFHPRNDIDAVSERVAAYLAMGSSL